MNLTRRIKLTGEELKKIRLANRLTQAQLADKLGVYPSNLCNMELGNIYIQPYIEKLVKSLIKTGELKHDKN